jgi:hypothetical protein
VAFASPNQKPGAEIEVRAVAMPCRSIASMDFCGDQSGVLAETLIGPMRSSPTSLT